MESEIATNALIAYLMQYLGLGAVFMFGLVVAFKQGDVGTKTPRQRRWLIILIGGYVLYATVHGILQFVTPWI